MKWTQFQRKYFAELERKPDAWASIVKVAKREPISMLYSSHDSKHNNPVALKSYLEKKLELKSAAAGHH